MPVLAVTSAEGSSPAGPSAAPSVRFTRAGSTVRPVRCFRVSAVRRPVGVSMPWVPQSVDATFSLMDPSLATGIRAMPGAMPAPSSYAFRQSSSRLIHDFLGVLLRPWRGQQPGCSSGHPGGVRRHRGDRRCLPRLREPPLRPGRFLRFWQGSDGPSGPYRGRGISASRARPSDKGVGYRPSQSTIRVSSTSTVIEAVVAGRKSAVSAGARKSASTTRR